MIRNPLVVFCLALGLASGCDSNKSGVTVGTKSVEGCELSLDTLSGSEWVYQDVTPDGDKPNPVFGRIKFETEGGKLSAKYNARSTSSVYDYQCVAKGKELHCKEKPMPQDWCRALLAGGGTCDVATLTTIDPDLDLAAAAKGVAAGTAEFKEAKAKLKGRALKDFMLGNNNLGNKLQARIYVKVNTRKCQLTVSDFYMTIYNGRSIEDSNPNGTNAFVKNELGELMWESCDGTQSKNFVARPEMGFPKNPGKIGHLARYTVGQQAQFTYLGLDGQIPPEGCSFSFDVWRDGKPVGRDLKPGTTEVKHKGKKLQVAAWMWDKTFDAPSGPQGELIAMSRYKTCGGVKESVGTACVAVKAD
jgi:hypothetical protein